MKSLGFASLLLAGCGDHGDTSIPGLFFPMLEPGVINVRDQFEVFGVGAEIDGTREYRWVCGDDQAQIRLENDDFLGSGSFRLEILDASGAVVHDNSYGTGLLTASIDAASRPGGLPGTWTLRFSFDHLVLVGVLEISADSIFDINKVEIGGGYEGSAELTFHVGWPAGSKTLRFGAGMDAGTVQIRIWDGADAPVFDLTYPAAASAAAYQDTATGAAGTWTIRITLIGVSDGGSIKIPF
jgi:hypothetical protein